MGECDKIKESAEGKKSESSKRSGVSPKRTVKKARGKKMWNSLRVRSLVITGRYLLKAPKLIRCTIDNIKAGTNTIERLATKPMKGLEMNIPSNERNSPMKPEVKGKPELAMEKKSKKET